MCDICFALKLTIRFGTPLAITSQVKSLKMMLKITLAAMLFGGIPGVLAAEAPTGRFIYAGERNGEIYSYDMDAGHKQVGSFLTAEDIKEVRGACAIAATG